ncbi:hypothetical protein PTRG_04502 [Pyrenophora tritici-repentis Pt-1C-BFP]|uniref:Uncharacterized protein n=1 Tax=Pyrenophora tritici-repentis (strain Pt-1C-BFP) TaxID=426418 RepID=B2W4F2_PYRTR|nr:uncharacterized protein PTRG_04502 [Pyrenophora tritici-repentis Pt-1C-BFP]EDU47409.1 hypothetical protein PTRG_04502 [Pyrenophora tritici-repentis Pt-1C-BFP]
MVVVVASLAEPVYWVLRRADMSQHGEPSSALVAGKPIYAPPTHGNTIPLVHTVTHKDIVDCKAVCICDKRQTWNRLCATKYHVSYCSVQGPIATASGTVTISRSPMSPSPTAFTHWVVYHV